MTIKVNLIQERRRANDNYGKVYARAKNSEPIDIAGLAKHMADHGSPFSTGTIQGILTDMVKCIKELILTGQPVKLADLAIFKISLVSGPANTAADFDLGTNLKGVKLLAQATGEMTRKELLKDVSFEYTDLANKVRAGLVDITQLYVDEEDDHSGSGSGSGGSNEPDPVRP
jgi:hypothetical protein